MDMQTLLVNSQEHRNLEIRHHKAQKTFCLDDSEEGQLKKKKTAFNLLQTGKVYVKK